MWAGESYEAVLAGVRPHPSGGICLWDAADYLRQLRIPARRTSWFFESERAILDVPSLNFVGGMHAIYWDGERLWDPNDGRPARLVWTRDLLDRKGSWGGTITAVSINEEPPLREIVERTLGEKT